MSIQKIKKTRLVGYQPRNLWLLCCLFLFPLVGCGAKTIPGTTLPNTKKNREIYQVVEQYRQAMESRNWKKLLTIVSPRYHETAGTPDTNDDYGYTELRRRLLSQDFKRIRFVRLWLTVEKIAFERKEAHVYLRSRYSFRYPRGEYRPGWNTGVNDQMLILEYARGQWLIVRGL